MLLITKPVGEIMNSIFTLKTRPSAGQHIVRLSESIDALKMELPSEAGIFDRDTEDHLWALMIHLAHRLARTSQQVYDCNSNICRSHLYVLLHRQTFVQSSRDNGSKEGLIALEAASKISRIVEDILSRDLIQFLQMHW